MNGIKLTRLVLLVVCGMLFSNAHARTSDPHGFGVWLAQWAQHARDLRNERLPCLRGDRSNCNSAFADGSGGSARKGQVDPFKRSLSTKRYKVKFKQPKRISNQTWRSIATYGGLGSWVSGGQFLILNDNPAKLLGIDAKGRNSDPQVQQLTAYMEDITPPVVTTDPLITTVAAGVGNNAFGALYDFEDEGVVGENQRGFQEISSLAGAQGLITAAADVPEPSTMTLIGAGLLILRLRTRGVKDGGLRPRQA